MGPSYDGLANPARNDRFARAAADRRTSEPTPVELKRKAPRHPISNTLWIALKPLSVHLPHGSIRITHLLHPETRTHPTKEQSFGPHTLTLFIPGA